MSVETSVAIAEPALDSRNIRIHKWISTLPNDLSRHQRLPSLTDSLVRADSPLLGFAPQESGSYDPLHRPSPNYVRRLPEELTLTKPRSPLEKSLPTPPTEARIPSPVPEDAEQEIDFPAPITRDLPAHLSFIQSRRPIARQPSLPIFGTTAHTYLRDSMTSPRIRSNSTVMPPARPELPPLRTQPSMPSIRAPPSTPIFPTASLSSDLERQKLNALFIASGLAEEEELEAEAEFLGYHSSSSQVYLGNRTSQELPTPVAHAPPIPQGPLTRDSDAMNSTYHSQTIISPRTSMSLEGVDEFDEDASYYGKEMNPLFSPYSRPPSISRPSAEVEIVDSATSKWSLSSSIQMDLDKSQRSSPAKSTKREKFKSFISRFTPNNQLPNADKQNFSIIADARSEKHIRRERSHSDLLTSRGSVSPQIQAVASSSWESVPPTPTTAASSMSMSVSTGYSPVTPSDNESESRDAVSMQAYRASEEKLASGAGLSRIDSPILAPDTYSSSPSWSGTNTSVPNSPVDTVAQPQLPLKHAMSTTSLKMHGLKGFASMIGLAPGDSSRDQSSSAPKAPKETEPVPQSKPAAPKTFKERMMLKNNGSALSLILGKGSNKSNKPKRKTFMSGFESDYRKYEAIGAWASAR